MSLELDQPETFSCGPTNLTITQLDWDTAVDIYLCGQNVKISVRE